MMADIIIVTKQNVISFGNAKETAWLIAVVGENGVEEQKELEGFY